MNQQQMGPIMVLNAKTQRQTGRPAQISNIRAARAVASIIRTTLGPRSMLKMLLDPMGSIVLTNDGHAILREVDVSHPTAKSMIELSRAQDEEVGDGTTSVIVLAAEVLSQAEAFLRQDNVHPTVIVAAYTKALAAALDIIEQHEAITVEITTCQDDDNTISGRHQPTEWMKKIVSSALSTKFSSRWNDKMVDMAIRSVLMVAVQPSTLTSSNFSPSITTSTTTTTTTTTTSTTTQPPPSTQVMEVDIKRYAKVEKIPGGEMDDCCVLDGVMFQKDTVHSGMRRCIQNPRILLLDTPLEYKKGESQTTMEINVHENETDGTGTGTAAGAAGQDWNTLLKLEEEYVANLCREIIAFQPDIVITEKGVSDLAQHYLHKANITAFRRLRKTDNNRLARAVGATIVSRTDEIQESDIGTACGLFEMRMINNEWFAYLTQCTNPKACTIVLRGGSKDVLNEMERNLQDAMQVVRNVVHRPSLVAGGGAIEMAVAAHLRIFGKQHVSGIQQAPFLAIADALEIIPRTLLQNCGVSSVIRKMTQLRAKHAAAAAAPSDGSRRCTWGVNGETGDLVDMQEYGVWEPVSVKMQTIKTAIESACMILRIDDIVSGSKKSSSSH